MPPQRAGAAPASTARSSPRRCSPPEAATCGRWRWRWRCSSPCSCTGPPKAMPSWSHVRASLAGIWPMVTASYVPLASLLVARVLGADTKTAATVALVVAIALLLVQGWVGGRASQLRGLRLLAVTLVAGAFGVVMILLKLVVTH